MLLPWSRTVIGATGVGYFDTWGLAGPLHVVVFVWALAVVGLSIVRKPAPAWVRSGLAGFALGAFSLGLAWPYLSARSAPASASWPWPSAASS